MNKKLLLTFGIPILLTGLVLASVFIANLDASVTVSEAVNVTQTDLVVNSFPGGETCESVEIQNDADWDLWADITFVETLNPSGVVYTINTPLSETLASGLNLVDVCFDVAEDSDVGTIEGTITIERVTQP